MFEYRLLYSFLSMALNRSNLSRIEFVLLFRPVFPACFAAQSSDNLLHRSSTLECYDISCIAPGTPFPDFQFYSKLPVL